MNENRIHVLPNVTKKVRNPLSLLVLGYFVIVLLGALLLSLPISSESGKSQPFLDALFVSSSGISTTGLTVVDTGRFYSMFGEIVLMFVFQIGGTGYMAFLIVMPFLLRQKGSIGLHVLARQSMATPDQWNLGAFFLSVLLYTFFCELVGTLVLALRWIPDFGVGKAFYLGLFHSISAFCTAGFSLFSDSLMGYSLDPVVNTTIMLLSISGGLGFIVVYNLFRWIGLRLKGKRRGKLDYHSRIVMGMSLLLFLTGAIVILVSEEWPSGFSVGKRFLVSLFQSVSASTTDGFNSVDIARMKTPGLTFFLILMFVGAAPGSTGGGIKNTSLAVLLVFCWNQLRGREKRIVFAKREIPDDAYLKASGIFFWFVLIIMTNLVILTFTEKSNVFPILFETVSALGNVGLSMGITSSLSPIGKILMMITMFIGRVGPLTFGLALTGQNPVRLFRYPKGEIHVG